MIELERSGKNRVEFNIDLYHLNSKLLSNNLIKNKNKDKKANMKKSVTDLKKLLIMFSLKMDEELCLLVLSKIQEKWMKPSGVFGTKMDLYIDVYIYIYIYIYECIRYDL
jgi:hypothetical protein